MEASFCVDALKEALVKYGPPEIMNSDQGSQFTSSDWLQTLTDAEVKISMDGRGRWVDNRMIERLWRSSNMSAFISMLSKTGSEARAGIAKWMTYYNAERPHSCHGILTPGQNMTPHEPSRKSRPDVKPGSTLNGLQYGPNSRTTSHYGTSWSWQRRSARCQSSNTAIASFDRGVEPCAVG